MNTPVNFKIYEPLLELESKFGSGGSGPFQPQQPAAVPGDIAIWGSGVNAGQTIDSGKLLSSFAVKPAFAKYSAPVQTLTATASPVLFANLVGSSSLVGPTGTISIASGIVTLTSSTTNATSWKIEFNPNYITDAQNTVASFQFQTPSGTNSGNPSILNNNESPPNTISSGTGIINEFVTVPASSSTTVSITALATTTGSTSLGLAPSTLPYISILQIQ